MSRQATFLFFCLVFSGQATMVLAAPQGARIKPSEIREIRLRQHYGGPKEKENYLVKFYWNGAATLEGRSGMKNIGVFAGRISKTRFRQLAKLLLHAKFFDSADLVTDDLASDYLAHGFGIDVIEVVCSGKHKDIYAWKGEGITTFDKITAVVRSEMQRANWKFQRKLGPLPKLKTGGRIAEGPMLDENGNFASGMKGVAMAGPINPVEREGDPPNQQPLSKAVITIRPEGGGKEIARKRTDEQGRFEIVLSPGKYLLVPLGPQASDTAPPEEPTPEGDSESSAAMLPRAESQTVIVEPGKFTDVVVNYDTGIR